MSDLPAPLESEHPKWRANFGFRISLPPAEMVAKVRDNAKVAWSEDGNPAPFPGAADPPFQAWPGAGGVVYVRRSTTIVETPSPYVALQVREAPWGAAVKGRFLRHPPRSPGLELTIRGALWLTTLYCWVYMFLLGWGALISPQLWIGAILAPVLLFTLKNRPQRKSMEAHGNALWALVGELFVPHALGEGEQDDPFREQRALKR